MLDIYCNGYRWFENYEETKENYLKDLANYNPYGSSDIQYYGREVLCFRDISELNTFIHYLTLLRDSVNQDVPKHPKIQKEFGSSQSPYFGSSLPDNIPYLGIEVFEGRLY